MGSNGKRVLGAADIIRGGTATGVGKVNVTSLDGEVVTVCHRPLSAAAMIAIQADAKEAEEIEKRGENPRHVERMCKTLADHLCDEQGQLVFNEDNIKEVPGNFLMRIMRAIAGDAAADTEVNPSSGPEETTSGSRTALQVT